MRLDILERRLSDFQGGNRGPTAGFELVSGASRARACSCSSRCNSLAREVPQISPAAQTFEKQSSARERAVRAWTAGFQGLNQPLLLISHTCCIILRAEGVSSPARRIIERCLATSRVTASPMGGRLKQRRRPIAWQQAFSTSMDLDGVARSSKYSATGWV